MGVNVRPPKHHYDVISYFSLCFRISILCIMHQSIPSVNNAPGQPPGFCAITFSLDSMPSELLGSSPVVTQGLPGVGLTIYYIKAPSCQLMPYEGTFLIQTDLLLN